MRRPLLIASLTSGLMLGMAAAASGWTPASAAGPGKKSENPAAVAARGLVRIALESELAGDRPGRDLYLNEAIEQDANNAQAHWQLGEIYTSSRWSSAEEACQLADKNRWRAEYRRKRSLVTNLPEDQFDLALWCKQSGLIDEGRAHFFYAWQDRPSLGENGEMFGLSLWDGAWLTPQQVRQENQRRKLDRTALAKWKPRLSALRRDLRSPDTEIRSRAERALAAITNPEAVPAIEEVFASDDQQQALTAIRVLANIRGQRSATALVRHASLSRFPEARRTAALALKSRSIYSYAPLLLASLESPIDARLDDISQDGTAMFRLYLVREGPMADLAVTQYVMAGPEGTRPGQARLAPSDAARAQQTAAREVTRIASQVTADNARIKEQNDRLGAALATAASVQKSDRPRKYWEWWYDYNDIYYPPERPVQRYEYAMPVSFSRVSECFAAGTPVWTANGKQPIEQIKVGDIVLAQDTETGELAFKPVASTSIRPSSPLLNMGLGGETITVTRGHPMWVIGQGWRMARELSEGDRVRTVSGPVAIESIEPGPEKEAFNLVVAEFNTYFAGEAKLLVHDNTLRRHTDALLPGFDPAAQRDDGDQ